MSYKSNMKTRIMVWILCVAMVFTTVNLPVFAIEANAEEMTGEDSEAVSEEITDDGICGSSVDNTPAKDNSTGEYIITSAAQLKWFADYIKETDNAAKARLGNYIDLSGYTNLMIGSKDKPFAGTFDGNGNTISNVNINSMLKSGSCSYAGLFGYVEGTSANHAVIKNLTVSGSINLDSSDTTENYVGSVVGVAYAYTDIDNVRSDVSITATMGTKAHIGGIVGSAEWNDNPGSTPINISRCSFAGSITTYSTDATGGIIGYIKYGTIINCINTGSISGFGNVSGILGYINNGSSGSFEMKNCISAGSVSDGANTAAFVCYKKCPASMFSGLYYDSYMITVPAYVRLEGGSDISSSSIVACTYDQMSSGEVTWAINGGTSEGDLVWYQKLGDDGDDYPGLKKAGDDSNTVYYSYADCEAEEMTYSNNAGLKQNGHSQWDNGKCGVCGYVCTHSSWDNGVCETCGQECAHSSWSNGKCATCGQECAHGSWNNSVCGTCEYVCTHNSWNNGVCGTCGYECPHSSWTNGVCETCGYVCPHENVNGDYCAKCGQSLIISVSYIYPVYNTANKPASGIKEWKNGTRNCRIITASDTTLGETGKITWYVVYSSELTINSTVTVNGNVNIILADGAKLTVNGSELSAGINVTGTDNSLTIYGQTAGSGRLTATGDGGAGIGGGNQGSGSNITINGGEVTATGDGGAGIGGGREGSGSDITINGGEVTATGENYGAGIGGGFNGSGSDITINGGKVTATGENYGAGIGGGHEGSGSNITINGGEVTATGGENGAGIGGGHEGSGSNITINGGEVTATGEENGAGIGGGFNGSGSDITIVSELYVYAGNDKDSATVINRYEELNWEVPLCGQSYVHIIAKPHTHTFSDGWSSDASGHWHACTSYGAKNACLEEEGAAKAPHSSWSNGKCETCGYACTHESITGDTCDICGLSGIISVSYTYPLYNADDEPTSGISEWKNGTQNCRIITATDTTLGETGQTTWYVVNSSDLTIDSTITVNGNVNIIIADDAKLTVNGSKLNAGINVTGNNSLTIYGQTAGSGKLITIGGDGGSGIGGEYLGSRSNITINGGEVTATGGVSGAGIGGGAGGSGSNITINGGEVTATGATGGAGIGDGMNGSGSNITINGGTVEAKGNEGGAGIGGGYLGSGSNITINGGTVEAKGNEGGAGIGGGYLGSGSNNITIDNKLYLYAGDNRASAGAITSLSSFYAHTYEYVYVGSIVAIYEGCSLSLSGDIGIDIYIKLNKATAENSNTKLNVWNGDKLTEIAVPSNTTNVEGSECYVFHYSIPAADYNTELKARVVCGDASGYTFTIRVADYIDYIQANESGKYDDATVNLVNAMEKYCEEAASYFAGNIETAQYDYSEVTGKLGSYKVNASDMGEGYLGTSLILNGKVTIRHYYIDNAVFAQIGVTGYKSVGGIYYYEIENISPADYDAIQTSGYSVYSYILAGLSNDECSYNFKNILCAMYEYSVAAEVYVSNN